MVILEGRDQNKSNPYFESMHDLVFSHTEVISLMQTYAMCDHGGSFDKFFESGIWIERTKISNGVYYKCDGYRTI